MNDVTLYHNPRCSKSRETLALLEAHGIRPRIVHYLETPPDTSTLRQLLELLAIEPRALLRTREPEYQTLGLDNTALGDDELIAALAANPKLLERPIVIRGNRAIIGRPPERVLELL
jgi:arsenate reductase